MTEKGLKVGDRVTRPLYMDDGTWAERGDDCLSESPLMHGTVIDTTLRKGATRLPLFKVRWDENGTERWYYEHGLSVEVQDG